MSFHLSVRAFPEGMELGSDSHSAREETEAETSTLTPLSLAVCSGCCRTHDLLQGDRWTKRMQSYIESLQGRKFRMHRNLVETSFNTRYF